MKKLLTMDVLVPNNDEDRSKIRYGNVNCGDSESLNCWTQLAYFDIIFEFYQNSLFFEIISSFICCIALHCIACEQQQQELTLQNDDDDDVMMIILRVEKHMYPSTYHPSIYLFIYLSINDWMNELKWNEWCVKWKKKEKEKKRREGEMDVFSFNIDLFDISHLYIYIYIYIGEIEDREIDNKKNIHTCIYDIYLFLWLYDHFFSVISYMIYYSNK